jgi:hypothetical protein
VDSLNPLMQPAQHPLQNGDARHSSNLAVQLLRVVRDLVCWGSRAGSSVAGKTGPNTQQADRKEQTKNNVVSRDQSPFGDSRDLA